MTKVIVDMENDLIEKVDGFAKETFRDRSKVIRHACTKLFLKQKDE